MHLQHKVQHPHRICYSIFNVADIRYDNVMWQYDISTCSHVEKDAGIPT